MTNSPTSMKIWVKQALKLLGHELKRGELNIIILAIVLSVATVLSLTGFSRYIHQALITQSTSFIAADRVLQTSRPISTDIIDKSQQLSLQKAEQIIMSSMIFSGDNMLLSEVMAVSSLYPLRGELLVSVGAEDKVQAMHSPRLGEVWLEPKLFSQLHLVLGNIIEIGASSFTVAGMIKKVPDASFSVFTAGPKVIMNINDMEKTKLVQPGSRLTYKYLFAGDVDNIEQFDTWISPKINDTQRWYDIKSKQSPLANALNKAEKYLSLASLLGIILASVAVAVASRRYSQKHQNTVAIFKSLGATKSHVRKVYYLHWALLSLLSIFIGLIVGYAISQVGLYLLQDYFVAQNNLSAQGDFGYYPFIVAIVTGLICAIAFATIPLLQLIETLPITLLKGYQPLQTIPKWLQLTPVVLAIIILLFLFSGNIIQSFALLLGGTVAVVILLRFSAMLINASRVIGTHSGKAWHLALANLKRRSKENSIQLVSFTIAIKLLLLILVIRGVLLNDWQAQLPENTPNVFLINISQQEVKQVDDFIREQQLVASDLYAVVRGRLTSVNEDTFQKDVTKENTNASDNGRQGVGRELNLTWREKLPNENTITEGKWWQENDNSPQVSIEKRIAKRLNIVLGDMLTFQIGSNVVKVPVTSIREVNWQSMQPNFYMIFNTNVLSDFPASYISSIYVSENKKQTLQIFLKQFPTITLIDVDALISQLRTVITQVSKAIEFILFLVVSAGCLVLFAQVQASMEEREREIAILRTLGAKGSLLKNSILFEFVAMGAIAGLMASVAMEISVYFLQTKLFDMQASFHFEYWLLGISAGAGFVGLVGLLSCWRLLNLSSVTLIKRTM